MDGLQIDDNLDEKVVDLLERSEKIETEIVIESSSTPETVSGRYGRDRGDVDEGDPEPDYRAPKDVHSDEPAVRGQQASPPGLPRPYIPNRPILGPG